MTEARLIKSGVLVKFSVRTESAEEFADLLCDLTDVANADRATRIWHALRFDGTHFGLFEAFDSDEERDSHFASPISAESGQRMAPHLAEPPEVTFVGVMSSKTV